jgi:ABC-type nitrate/sulfonate/bicarbonate transport system substrate-binding protein
MKGKIVLAVLAGALACLVPLLDGNKSAAREADAKGTFTLAWSEYPSWSVFGVASEKGLINGDKGKLGKLEEKWGVDIELKLLDYDGCINAYASKACDAACLTNMDTLSPALARKSVSIMPTSTSFGADACIVVGISDLEELKKHTVYGLTESVSDYAFSRILEKNGKNPADYKFEKLDPAEAARVMQTKAKNIDAIMVWNPFVLQTLNQRKDAKVLFDSTKIPEEIIDMVIVGDDVLKKPGGTEFACCIADCYYEFNKMLEDPSKRKGLLEDLGKKFSSLGADDMAKCCEQTRFYKTPDDALKLITGDKFKKTMEIVLENYMRRKVIKEKPKIGYGSAKDAPDAQFRIDPTYIKMVKDKK